MHAGKVLDGNDVLVPGSSKNNVSQYSRIVIIPVGTPYAGDGSLCIVIFFVFTSFFGGGGVKPGAKTFCKMGVCMPSAAADVAMHALVVAYPP